VTVLARNGHRLALESLLAFDRRVRSVVEVRLNGEQIASVCREGLEPLEPQNESVRVLDRTAIFAGMGSSMNGYHGRVRAAIVVKEKLSLIVFPLFDSLILVSADPEFPLQKTRQMARLLDTSSSPGSEAQESMATRSSIPTIRELRGNIL
jgi:hypothetical protein